MNIPMEADTREPAHFMPIPIPSLWTLTGRPPASLRSGCHGCRSLSSKFSAHDLMKETRERTGCTQMKHASCGLVQIADALFKPHVHRLPCRHLIQLLRVLSLLVHSMQQALVRMPFTELLSGSQITWRPQVPLGRHSHSKSLHKMRTVIASNFIIVHKASTVMNAPGIDILILGISKGILAISPQSNRAMPVLKGAGMIALELIDAASDSFPPLKIIAAGMKTIVRLVDVRDDYSAATMVIY